MVSILSIDPRVLGDLNSDAATKAFRGLLWCEAHRVGLSCHKVVISSNTNVPDGGIDAHVDGNPAADSLLVKGLTCFQLKTGPAFKPWQKGALRKELFGNPNTRAGKDTLAPQVRECLKKKGRYVLVSFGHDLTPKQMADANRSLKELVVGCGYKNPSVEVIGQGQLSGLFSLFPSLLLSLTGRGALPFLTVDEWRLRADMIQPLHLADDQQRIIDQIRDGLRGDQYRHIRLIAEPGLGKTRLALEALSADDLAHRVIYVPHAEDFEQNPLFSELLRKRPHEHVLLVIDECSERERASIWNAFREIAAVQLVTIDHGPERSRDAAMLILDLPRLADEKIKAILASYLGQSADPSHWVSWCEGSPRVAHAVGENLKRNPEDLLKPPATVPIWERFIAGYESVDSGNTRDVLVVLRHIALFTKFGFEDPVSAEAKFISQLVQHVAPSITWPRFQELVERQRSRRILQGKRTLFIAPKALHIYLWIDYWNTYGRDFSFLRFFADIPSELRHWFLQFFIYGHASPVACDAIAKILSPDGPFADHEFLTSQAGTRFINYLAEADPGNTLFLIERTFGRWGLEELKAFQGGRQDIVRALEKIAVWRQHFYRAAKLLAKLALAENANYANNSTGVLRDLFMVGNGWAGTQSPPGERFPVIQELLASRDKSEIDLGLSLCRSWFNTRGGIRIVGAEYQGLRPELAFWKPRVWGEIFDAWRLCWRHLYSVSRNWGTEQRQLANRVLVDEGLQLIHVKVMADEIIRTLFEVAEDPATDTRQFTQCLIQKLRFRSDKIPKRAESELKKLDRKLTGESFWSRFSRFVLNTSWDEDYRVKDGAVKELSLPSRRIEDLVSEVVNEPAILTDHISKIVSADGHRLAEFGHKLSLKLNHETIIRQIIDLQLRTLASGNTQFITGYFNGLRKCSPAVWERHISELLTADGTRELAVTLVVGSGATESLVRTLIRMYSEHAVTASVFSRLWWTTARDGLSPQLLEEVLRALVARSDRDALTVAIELAAYYFFDKKEPKSCDEQLLFRLLTAQPLFIGDSNNREQGAGCDWYSVAKGFRARFPTRDLELLASILPQMETISSIRQISYPLQLADELVADHPDEAWSMISKRLEVRDQSDWWLVSWLGGDSIFNEEERNGPITAFDPEAVMRWITEDPDRRSGKILSCLPTTLDEDHGGKVTKQFIETFGDNELAEDIIGHFWIGGWSGPESQYLARKRDKARKWISEAKSGKILAWLHRYVEHLNKRIANAELREEREF